MIAIIICSCAFIINVIFSILDIKETKKYKEQVKEIQNKYTKLNEQLEYIYKEKKEHV